MSKYVIELNSDYIKSIVAFGMMGDKGISTVFKIDELEELTSVKKTEYQRGFEDGKAVNDKGCEGCKYSGTLQGSSPCFNCSNYYQNNWTAKDDKIEVGDIVERYLDDKLDSAGIYLGEDGDYWNCLFWTGAVFSTFAYPKNQFKKTGRHFDIASILEDMRK